MIAQVVAETMVSQFLQKDMLINNCLLSANSSEHSSFKSIYIGFVLVMQVWAASHGTLFRHTTVAFHFV